MKVTEQNFVEQIIRKNEKALEYCMIRYGGLVKAVVHRHLGQLDRFEEECINDVFFAVWEHADSYRSDKNSFANWIAGVARLKALDCKRRYARQLLEVGWDDALANSTGAPDAGLSALEEEISSDMAELLSCLSVSDRELFMKRYIEEEDLDKISRDTGMSKPVIYNHLSRGKKKIRRHFQRREEIVR